MNSTGHCYNAYGVIKPRNLPYPLLQLTYIVPGVFRPIRLVRPSKLKWETRAMGRFSDVVCRLQKQGAGGPEPEFPAPKPVLGTDGQGARPPWGPEFMAGFSDRIAAKDPQKSGGSRILPRFRQFCLTIGAGNSEIGGCLHLAAFPRDFGRPPSGPVFRQNRG